MKSFIKKVMIVVVVLATMVDWPVEIDAFNAKPIVKPIVKGSTSLLKSCSRNVEKNVNETTQVTKEIVNEAAKNAAENPNIQYGVARGSINAIRINARTKSQSSIVTCMRCSGRGSVQGTDGYIYSCSWCNGTGKIFTK